MTTDELDELLLNQSFEVFYNETDALLAEAEQMLLNINIEHPDLDEIRSIALAIRLTKEIAEMLHSTDIDAIDMTGISDVSDDLLNKIFQYEITVTAEHVETLITVKSLLQVEINKHRSFTPDFDVIVNAGLAKVAL